METATSEPKGGHIFVTIGVLCVLSVICIGWYRYAYNRDYLLFDKISCDQTKESCFVEGDGGDLSIYKIIEIKAYAAPVCNPWQGDCPELSCENLPQNQCMTYTCSDNAKAQFGIDASCSIQ